MSQLHSTDSTELPGISSAGQSAIDCESHYNRDPWTDDPGEDAWMLRLECMPGQFFTFHGDELRAPGFGTTDDKVAFTLRYVCHFLLNQIDDSGLEEVCRSLAEFYSYYRPTEHTPQLPYKRRQHVIDCSRSTNEEQVHPEFVWDKDIFDAMQATEEFSKETHANY